MGERLTSKRRRFGLIWLVLGWAWLVACLGLAVDFATDYRSLTKWVGEWEFYWFGRYFPAVTITLGVLIAILPLLVIAWILRWRRHRYMMQMGGPERPEDPLVRAIRSAARSDRFFGILSVLLLLSALGALVIASHAPTAEGPVRRIDLDAPTASTAPVEGHARYGASIRVGRVARIEESVGFAARAIWVAPVYGVSHAEAARPRYWTELLPAGEQNHFRRIGNGVLVRGGLPPEVGPLYRAIGIAVPADAALLMLDSDRPRWRMIALAVQAAIVSLLALVIALLMRRQARRLRARAARFPNRQRPQRLP